MKKIFIALILVSPLFLFISCKREMNNQQINQETKELTDAKIIEVFSTIGKLHNIGLDSIYNDLKNNSTILNGMPNTVEKHNLIYSLINNSIHKFIRVNLQNHTTDIDETLNSVFKNSSNNSLSGVDLVTQITKSKNAQRLSPLYLSLLNKIDSLININAGEQIYKDFTRENIKLLDDIFEKMQFVSSTSIAFNSTNYWKNNIGKWNHLLKPNFVEKNIMMADADTDPKADPNKNANEVGKADVAGIIYGAASGCVYGAIGGTATLPVIGTITGCLGAGAVGALTGGLGNSAKKAVDNFVDWLTK